jgi:hypothetical protein
MAVNNLYVTYDDDGQPHFHVNDEEVTQQEWMLRHPMMKEDSTNGRNSDSGQLGRLGGESSVPADGPDLKERQRQGVREHRAKLKAAEAESRQGATGTGGAGQGEDAVG